MFIVWFPLRIWGYDEFCASWGFDEGFLLIVKLRFVCVGEITLVWVCFVVFVVAFCWLVRVLVVLLLATCFVIELVILVGVVV